MSNPQLEATPAHHATTPACWTLPLLAVAGFAIGLFNAPIGDDVLLLQRLAEVQPGDLHRLFGENYWGSLHQLGLYRPLSLSLISLQAWLFGSENMAGYHAMNLILHASCSLLVYRVFARCVDHRIAWMAGALFATHPIHAEAVVTLYGQVDLWAALFGLMAVERALPSQHSAVTGPRSFEAGRLGAALVFYLLALLCKESAIVVPLLVSALGAASYRSEQHGLRRWLGTTELSLGLIALLYLGLRFAVLGQLLIPAESSVLAGAGGFKPPLVSLGTYMRLLVFPSGQTIYYGHLRDALFGSAWREVLWLGGSALVIAIACLRHPRRGIALGAGWIASALLPVANFLPIGIIAAERALYLPSAGFALLLALGIDALARGAKQPRAGLVLTAVILLLYTGASARVAWDWRTPYTLWQTTVEAHPRSPKAHAAYGMEILERARQGDSSGAAEEIQRAQLEFRRALELNPASADARIGLGVAALMRSDCTEAKRHLTEAQALRPGDPTLAELMRACP